jgi:putative SOS response-associated peptidase YedK
MCGRFTLQQTTDQIAMRFQVQSVQADVSPRYNIAPTQPVAVVTVNSPRTLRMMEWGLVPSWAKDRSLGSKMINARAETLAEKPSFKQALMRRRCLIPASGFYEWQQAGERKQPIYIHRPDGDLFAFAGLWEENTQVGGEPIRTCTIITLGANALMQDIHQRMPAILRPELEATWLDHSLSVDVALACLEPYPAEGMEAYAVSCAVNSPTNDTPVCIRPAALAL